MDTGQERKRKGAILRRARERMRPRVTQQQLADKVGVHVKTIQNHEAGESWTEGTVDRIMDELGLGPEDLESEPTQLANEAADALVWRRFADDTQVMLLVLGAWLSKFPAERRRDEIARLTDYMWQRDAE